MGKYLGRWVLYLLPSLLLSVASPMLSQADETTTFQERKHERADALRKESMDRARSRLGYEFVQPGIATRHIDFWALSAQAARLGAMLDATLSQMRGAPPGYGQNPAFPPGPTAGLAPRVQGKGYLSALYGPKGPTAKSVRALLEYRLVVIGNPRLAVGNVEEKKDRVMVDIVTKDGSLVDRYSIDKQTGRWEAK